MPRFLRSMATNLGTAGQMLSFLWKKKQFWLLPMVVLLLTLGLLLMFASSTGIGPFIYTLF